MCSGTYSPGRATSGRGKSASGFSTGASMADMMPALMAPPELAQRVLAGDRSALARAITLAQDGGEAGRELIRELYPSTGRARIVGVTGPPGAGKSTLIGALVARRRAAGEDVAVLSVDPTSPFSGGAV